MSYESSDLKARWMLVERAEQAFAAGEQAVAASLVRACVYLENRAKYARAPWPKSQVRAALSSGGVQ